MIFNSLNSVLAQSVVQTLEQPDLVNSTHKFNIETICGVLLLLVMGIGLGIWIGYKNVKGRKVRVYRTSSHHRHSSSKRRNGSSSEENGTESEEKEDKEETPESTPKEVRANDGENGEKEDRESSSEGHGKSRKRRHRREHRPRGTSLAESGEGLPPPRPPGVPPPAFIKRDE